MGGADESQEGALDIDASLLDPSSGLYAQPFFLAALSWRVIACRRVLRPLAFAQLEVVDGLPDGPPVPSDPRVVTAMIRATLRTSDVAARLSDGTYALMLEDTPEDGAVWAVERLRRGAGHPAGRSSAPSRGGVLPGPRPDADRHRPGRAGGVRHRP